MPDLFELIARWWKQIGGLLLLSLLTAGILLWMKPNQYLSTATALPASAFATDKARIFNQNIEALYSELGTADDLDMVLGTAQLDTVYLALTDQFNVFDHYKLKGPDARIKAARCLRKNSRIYKSEYGELKVKVWDTDPNLAPQLANAIMEFLQSAHSQAMNAGNEARLQSLKDALKKIKDSTRGNADPAESRERIAEYEKLIGQYQLMVDGHSPSLVITEKARPSPWPDRPKRLMIMVATGVLALLFGLLLALLLERKKLSRLETTG